MAELKVGRTLIAYQHIDKHTPYFFFILNMALFELVQSLDRGVRTLNDLVDYKPQGGTMFQRSDLECNTIHREELL